MRLFLLTILKLSCVALGSLPVVGWAEALPDEVIPLFSQRTWTRADGLPGDEVTAICQDSSGFLWIASWSGLARFDGARFRTYDLVGEGRTSHGLGVASVVADSVDETVWAAPISGGVVRLKNGRFEREPLPAAYAQRRVARLFVAADRALWICFEGGEVMRVQDERYEIFGPEEGLGPLRAAQIASDGAGRVWLASGPLLLRYEAGRLQPFRFDGIQESVRLGSARQDGPWVLVRGWLRKIVADQLPVKIKVNASFNAYSVQALLEDSHGAVWTSTRTRGVRRLTLPDEESDLIVATPDDVGVLFEDRSGNVWAGANGGGLVRVRSSIARRLAKEQGLLDNHALSVCEDNSGALWVADRDGGLAYVNQQGRFYTLLPPSVRETFVVRSVVPAGREGVWAATSHGLWRADKQGLHSERGIETPAGHGNLRVVHLTRGGDMWVALAPSRLARFRAGKWQEFKAGDGLGEGIVHAIAEDAEGRIWVGTENSQLFREANGRFEEVRLGGLDAGAGGIQALHFDAAGVGWIGTASRGLLRIGATSDRALTEAHGLPTSNLTQLIGDDFGHLWFGSPEGIFHVSRTELEAWFAGSVERVDAALIGADEGIAEGPCASLHQPSAWRSRDGRLWFATRQGVVAIDPRREQPAAPSLVARVDGVRVDGVSLDGASPVQVPALTHAVELEYSVLCLSTPGRVRTEVRLRGYDEEWLAGDSRGVARYTRLPPGNYVFEITARVAGRPTSETRFELPLAVAAAWWQKPGVHLLGGLALLAGAGLTVRVWSHRRLCARLAELERASALERERARIAQNIHDDLGSGLTRISLLTQSAAPGDGRSQLDRIYHTVSDLTQSMDEIVWAVNPKNDNLEGFANYLVEFAQGYLTDSGLRCRVDVPPLLPDRALPAQFRHHLFLSCKEALNNVVKHARATEVILRLQVDEQMLVLAIIDNGCGMEGASGDARARRAGSKNGLANLRARLAALGGECLLATSGSGTTVTLSAPWPLQAASS